MSFISGSLALILGSAATAAVVALYFLKLKRRDHVVSSTLLWRRSLNDLAQKRGQTLAQMALAWVLRHSAVTTALMGASRPEQIEDSVGVINNLDFSSEELATIETILE